MEFDDPELRDRYESLPETSDLFPAQASILMSRILQPLGLKPTFQVVNRLIFYLTTNAFPYLVAVQ